MPKLAVNESIIINKTPEDVFNLLSDFSNWEPWSPWLIADPDAKVTVADDKKFQEWSGDVSGVGNMKIIGEKPHEQIDIDLTFLKPWKSTAKVSFIIKPVDNGTSVTWTMDSSLPFFLFWMKKMMNALIGMDYTRGLNMLKEYAEDGKTKSILEIKGNTVFEGCNYVGIKTDTTMDKMAESMETNYTKLQEYIRGEHLDKVAGFPFSIYHKWNPTNGIVSYTAAIPVKGEVELLPGMITGKYPKTKMHTIKHTGPYLHIGNAWSAQYARKSSKTIKVNKKIDPIEEYLNSPKNTPENELETQIHFAVK